MNLALVLALVGVAMPQPWGDLYRRDHVLVLGAPGCGKTPFAASLAAAARRVVYYDPTGEWTPLGETVSGELVRELVEADAVAAADDLLAGTFRRLVVTPSDDEEEAVEDFRATVKLCRAAAHHGGLVFLADEVGDLTDGGAAATLRALHRNGHKAGIATILASPCWTDIPARCRATRSRVYSFAQLADADIETMNRELGRVVPGFGELAAAWKYPAPPVAWVSPTLHA